MTSHDWQPDPKTPPKKKKKRKVIIVYKSKMGTTYNSGSADKLPKVALVERMTGRMTSQKWLKDKTLVTWHMYKHSLFPVGRHSLDGSSQDLSQQGVNCIRLHRRKQRPSQTDKHCEDKWGKIHQPDCWNNKQAFCYCPRVHFQTVWLLLAFLVWKIKHWLYV